MTKEKKALIRAQYLRDRVHETFLMLAVEEEIMNTKDCADLAAAFMAETQIYYEEMVFGYDQETTAQFLETTPPAAYRAAKGI